MHTGANLFILGDAAVFVVGGERGETSALGANALTASPLLEG